MTKPELSLHRPARWARFPAVAAGVIGLVLSTGSLAADKPAAPAARGAAPAAAAQSKAATAAAAPRMARVAQGGKVELKASSLSNEELASKRPDYAALKPRARTNKE